MAAILQVDDLSVLYGKVEAFHGGKLTVEAGQIVSVMVQTARGNRRC